MAEPTQPADLPEWADGGSARLVKPTSAKRQKGFGVGEHPLSEFLNWWMNLVYLWVVYLQAWVAYWKALPPGAWQFIGVFTIDSNGSTGTYAVTYNPKKLTRTGGTATVQDVLYIPITGLQLGQVITSIDVRVKVGGGAAAMQVDLMETTGLNSTGGDPSEGGAGSVTSAASAGNKILTITPGSPITVTNDRDFVLRWGPRNGGDILYGFRIN